MGHLCHESSCITGFVLNTESSEGKCNHLGWRSHHKNMILLAINHFTLQGNPENKEGGYLMFLFLNFSIKETVLKKKKRIAF